MSLRLIILAFFLLSCCFASAQSYMRPFEQLKGDVLEIYQADFDVTERTDTWEIKEQKFLRGQQYAYTPKQQVEYFRYFHDGKTVVFTDEMTLSDGLVASGQSYGYGAKLKAKVVYKYNADQQLISRECFDIDTNEKSESYAYYYEGSQLVKSVYDLKKNIPFQVEYFFEHGAHVESKRYLGEDGLQWNAKITNNDNGDPSHVLFYNGNNELTNEVNYVYRYDEKGNYTDCLAYDKSAAKITRTIRYISYRNEATPTLSAQQLEGEWVSWDGNFHVRFHAGRAKVKSTSKYNRRALEEENAYTFLPYSNELQLDVRPDAGTKNFDIVYNGTLLLLLDDRGEELVLTKTASSPSQIATQKVSNQFKIKGRSKAFGLYNKAGEEILAPLYQEIIFLSPTVLAVKKDYIWALANIEGEFQSEFIYSKLIPAPNGYIYFTQANESGIMRADGSIAIESSKYNRMSMINSSEIAVRAARESKTQVIDFEGNTILSEKYYGYTPLTFGRTYMQVSDKPKAYDFLNKNYEVIPTDLPYPARSIKGIAPNSFLANLGGSMLLIDSTGQVISDTYYSIKPINGLCYIVKKDSKLGLMSLDGQLLTDLDFDEIGTIAAFDKTFNTTLVTEYDKAMLFKKGNEFGYLTGLGKMEPFSFPEFLLREDISKTFKEPNVFTMRHSANWKVSYQSLVSTAKYAKANLVRYKVQAYSGDLKSTLAMHFRNFGASGLQSTTIDSRAAFSGNTNEGQTNTQHLFIKLSNKQYLHLEFIANKSQLLPMLAEFAFMQQTIKITSPNN